jgi:hypothetical protein
LSEKELMVILIPKQNLAGNIKKHAMSLIGIPIGLYGYIFPGNINLMVLELYSSKKYRFLLLILGLILVFESIYCALSLIFLNAITSNSKLFTSIEFVSYGLIFIMGLWMLLENGNNKKASHQNTIFRGVLSIIIHPQQIPFWVFAGILLNPVIRFNMDYRTLVAFVFFNALGTLLAMFIYINFGNKILNYSKLNITHINKVMGVAYILLVLYHLYPYRTGIIKIMF